MSPALKEGWLIEYIPVNLKEVKSGDVVIYSKFTGKEPLICQRVLCKIRWGKRLFFFLRGDNSIYHGLIPAENIVGKLTDARDIINNTRIERKVWQRGSFCLSFYNYFFCFIYIILFSVKIALFGRRKNAITSLIFKCFCKTHHLLPKVFVKQK